jgi:hypothetical protein
MPKKLKFDDLKSIVKAQEIDGDLVLDVLANPYGSPEELDSDGEYFAPDTDFNVEHEKADGIPVAFYHGYNENGSRDPSPRNKILGKTSARWVDGDGVWYRVILDKTKDLAVEVYDEAKKGILRASTGTMSLFARTNWEDGKITSWLNGELSLIPLKGRMAPANYSAIAYALKKRKDLELSESQSTQSETLAVSAGKTDNNSKTKGNPKMPTNEEIMAMVQQSVNETLAPAIKSAMKDLDDEKKAEQEKQDAIEARAQELADEKIAKMQADTGDTRPDNGSNLPQNVKMQGRAMISDAYSPEDVAFALQFAKSARNAEGDHQFNREFVKSHTERLMSRMEGDDGKDPHFAKARVMIQHQKAIKADELSNTEQSGFGADWLAQMIAPKFWEKVRAQTVMMNVLPFDAIPDGWNSMKYFVEGSDPVVYKIPEATDATGNTPDETLILGKTGTDKEDLSLGKLASRVAWSYEVGQGTGGGVFSYAPVAQRNAQKAMAEVIESAIIDGDTVLTASTNINDIAGTPSANDAFTVVNGLRKYALITDPTKSLDNAGADVDVTLLKRLRAKLGAGGAFGLNPDNFFYIVNPSVYYALLSLDIYSTVANYGAQASNVSGVLRFPDGSQVIPSAFAQKATGKNTSLLSNTAGKIDQDTTSNNVAGVAMAVMPQNWQGGYKELMRTVTEYKSESDAWVMSMFAQIGLTTIGDGVSLIYNIVEA